tara:strand:- start:1369 stop:3222 length:1854 start_codon:yes stop_codon:yes gene_type:complete
MVKKKKETNEGFLHKVGKFLVAAWGYIVVGRDYFWKAVRFTLATGIFLYIAISVVISLISPLWQESNEIDPTGKVVVFSPQGVVVDQPPSPPPAQWWEDLDGVIPSQNGTIYYPYQDMLEYFEDFKNDERVDAMIFDPSGLGVSIVYALPIAKKMKEAVDAGKEIVVRSDFLTDGTYLLASTATEISVPTYSGISINGFGGARQYLKNFFEKFLITPRIFAAGDFKTGPEPYTSDRMSDEAKANLAFYDPLWKKWKDFVYENREIDLQWLADESYKQIIDGSVDPLESPLVWGAVDVIEESDAFDDRMKEKFGTAEDDDEALNAVYYRSYLASFEEDMPSKSKNEIKVVTVEGTIMGGPVVYGQAGSDGIVEMLKEAHEDEDTKAIVLRVNSPGGSVVDSDYMRWEIEKAQEKGIPVVVSMGTLAASGGYWISSLADKIYAEPDTITGSIGVYGTLFSFEKIFDWMGINYDGYSTTKWGAFDLTAMDWPEEFENLVRAGIYSTYDKFTSQVANDRGIPIEKVREIAKGRVYSGEMALEIDLVDELGTLDDAIKYVAESAELEDYKVEHVIPPAPAANYMFQFDFIKSLFDTKQNNHFTAKDVYKNIRIYCFECEVVD